MNGTPAPSLTTRLLHLGLATGVTLQLFFSTFMDRPRPGEAIAAISADAFDAHEINGLLSLAIILCWLLWLFLRRKENGPHALFPWFSRIRREQLFAATRRTLTAVRRRQRPREKDNAIVACAVHGLGALSAIGMAVSGAAVWLGMSANGELTAWARPVLEVHHALAALMWTYVLAHAAMALLHHERGDNTLRRMFSLSSAKRRIGE